MKDPVVICPACHRPGHLSDFSYLGNQRVKCNMCNTYLDARVKCPVCTRLVILKYPLWFKLNPFAPLIVFTKMVSGSISHQRMHCPHCLYNDTYENFDQAFVFNGNYSIYSIK